MEAKELLNKNRFKNKKDLARALAAALSLQCSAEQLHRAMLSNHGLRRFNMLDNPSSWANQLLKSTNKNYQEAGLVWRRVLHLRIHQPTNYNQSMHEELQRALDKLPTVRTRNYFEDDAVACIRHALSCIHQASSPAGPPAASSKRERVEDLERNAKRLKQLIANAEAEAGIPDLRKQYKEAVTSSTLPRWLQLDPLRLATSR